MRKEVLLAPMVIGLSLWSCESGTDETGSLKSSGLKDGEWSIPVSEVRDGGPGKDGIPALADPEFIGIDEATYLKEHDLVIGFAKGDVSRAYPHSILDWHEIVNDRVEDINISVTYCPLTGTGIGWDREIDGNVTTFGVSGLLYNSNLIPYDRETGSNWTQIGLECVNGSLIGAKAKTHVLVETTWKTWKEMYPASMVLSKSTGYSRNYGHYPYGQYRTDHDYFIFPVANKDDRRPNKERVHGIVYNGTSRVYPMGSFGDQVTVVEDEIYGEAFVVVGSKVDNFAVSFFRDPGDGTILTFCGVQNQYPVVMTDAEGSSWDVFGRALTGPREGTQLAHANSFMGYWFSFAAFYPDVSVYGE